MKEELSDPGFPKGSIFRFLELRIRIEAALHRGDQAAAILEEEFSDGALETSNIED